MTLAQQHAARNRKPLTPAHGRCRWIVQPTDLFPHPGVIDICGTVYTVHCLSDGYRLTKYPDGAAYDLPLTLDSCDCADATFRLERSAGQCKHARGLRAALLALGVDVPPSPRPAA